MVTNIKTITKEKVEKQLKKIIDPELNVNIVDLGFIYGIEICPSTRSGKIKKRSKVNIKNPEKVNVNIKMTLSSPGCPLSYYFDEWVRERVLEIKGVKNVTINLVWEPAWNPDMMSDKAKEQLEVSF